MVAVMRELFEPFPAFMFPEPFFLSERIGRRLLDAWDRVSSEALRSGDAERLHSAREDYHTVLLGLIKLLDGYQMLAGNLRGDFDYPPSAWRERVQESRDEIQKHYDSLFPRWQTLDDLEAILLERITPSREERLELVKRFPPPQSWYEETENPFEREESS